MVVFRKCTDLTALVLSRFELFQLTAIVELVSVKRNTQTRKIPVRYCVIVWLLVLLKFTMPSKYRRKTNKFYRCTLLGYISRYIKLYIFTNAHTFYINLYTISQSHTEISFPQLLNSNLNLTSI